MNRTQLNGLMTTATKAMLASGSGYQCIETEWNQHDRILRIFVDHEDGVGLDDCLKANRILGEESVIDCELPTGSTLEVSSPGIERPLRRLVDFEKYIGSQVQVRLGAKLQGRRRDIGRLISAGEDGNIVVDTEAGDWVFPVESVLKANLVYEWQN